MNPDALEAAAASWGGPGTMLHIVDRASGGDGAVMACVEAASAGGVEHAAWVLGTVDDVRAARSAGLSGALGVTYSLGAPETSVRSVWRVRAALGEAPGAVVAWSPASLHVAAAVFGGRGRHVAERAAPILGVMPVGPGAAGAGWLGRRRLRRAVHAGTIVPLGESLQKAWAGAVGIGVTAIPPPVAAVDVTPARREAERRRLGIEAGELAVLLLADPPSRGNGRRFAQAVGMARLTGLPVVGMMHRETRDWDRALRFVGMHRREWDLIRVEGMLAETLAAADLCVWDPGAGPGAAAEAGLTQGPVLALAAAGAGIPIVAPDTPLTREVLGPAGEMCLATGWEERVWAGRITALAGAGARAEAGRLLRGAHARGHGAFHARLVETIRVAAMNTQTAAAWWSAVERGTIA